MPAKLVTTLVLSAGMLAGLNAAEAQAAGFDKALRVLEAANNSSKSAASRSADDSRRARSKASSHHAKPPRFATPAARGARRAARSRRGTARAVSAQHGYPAHSATGLQCSVVNGVANFESFALSADKWRWFDGGPTIYTWANQYVYFRIWVGRGTAAGGYDWTVGNWARSSTGAPYNWEAFIGGRWIDAASGDYGILPFPVTSYMVGSLSYVPVARRQTRAVYYEWQWNRFDQAWRFTGEWAQAFDRVGDYSCG